jgi:hypothetical protein
METAAICLKNLKHTDWNGKVSDPFLENPGDRDVTLFTTLMVAKPFATAKALAFWKLGRWLLMALTANQQGHMLAKQKI